MNLDSLIVTVPVSSPLHPQGCLPLLKGHLNAKGFNAKILDTNIKFFHWFLGESDVHLSMESIFDDPLKILAYYAEIEKKLWRKSQKYEGLDLGIRHLNMKYDRILFDSVLQAISDEKSNPFIEFYDEIFEKHYDGTGIKIAGISITFQDQIIAAFTLANILRQRMPNVKIVMGGQMVTRCYKSMINHQNLCEFYDYLALWDGELVLEDIHRREVREEQIDFVNVIDVRNSKGTVDRRSRAPRGAEIPYMDFDDIDFNDYFFPDMLIPLQTTRGCYGKCEFCAIPYGSNSYRTRNKDLLIQDIVQIQEHTLKRYGKKATYFKFMEDTSSPTLLYDLSVEIEKGGLDVKWETFARMEKAFTKPGMFEQLYRGGCRKIHWGLESNDPDVLKNMNKKTSVSYLDEVLKLADKAGILNFCFVLIGFPQETEMARERMIGYIISNKHIHTITNTTFDLTRGAPMELNYEENNQHKVTMVPAKDFQVRLPYMVDGDPEWKSRIVAWAQRMMIDLLGERPDIGFMSLFPDQVRGILCDRFTNRWGQIFLEKYGKESIRKILRDTEKYAHDYAEKREIDPNMLPEPLRREHFRTKEDLEQIAQATMARKTYEKRRMRQV